MRKTLLLCSAMLLSSAAMAEEKTEEKKSPWIGKYPMSFITKTRTANTVGEGRLSLAMKFQTMNCDEMMVGDDYNDMDGINEYDQLKTVFTAKWGWAENHHLALGIPYIWSDFHNSKTSLDHEDFGNVFIFEKWKFIEETELCPAVSADIWYYFGSGDSENKVGSDDDSAKFAFSVSKAWRDFSLHINPAYRWNLHDGIDISEVNVGCYYNLNKSLKLVMEYNFTGKESKGKCHDLVPGILWKPSKHSSIKFGTVINLQSDMKYRDDLGVCLKMFYKF